MKVKWMISCVVICIGKSVFHQLKLNIVTALFILLLIPHEFIYSILVAHDSRSAWKWRHAKIICFFVVVNLTCPVPRCKKDWKKLCVSFERSKYSKCVEMLVWLNTIVHTVTVLICYEANQYIGLGINSWCVWTKFIKLIRRKIIKIVAIRCQVLKLKCTSAPPDRQDGFNGS